jgi:hypothetical protein
LKEKRCLIACSKINNLIVVVSVQGVLKKVAEMGLNSLEGTVSARNTNFGSL